MEISVGIIGAGVSGLLACKHTAEKGFRPIVFEAEDSIGGVWNNQTVETTVLQSHRDYYMFSDFPWPSSVKEEYPNHHKVLDYIKSYAHHFDLLQHIKFNSNVLAIEYICDSQNDEMLSWSHDDQATRPQGKWKITVENTLDHSAQVYEVEFVMLCIGQYSGLPKYPDFPPNKGPEVFDGKVMHAVDYARMRDADAAKLIKGKRVAVVGFQKYALDIATECATANGLENPCTLIYKTAHWTIPDYYPWGVPLALLYLNRFSELLVHKPGEGWLLSLLATLLTPLAWLISKFVESYIKSKLPLKKHGTIPKLSFAQDIHTCTILIVPEKFYEKVEEGSIILQKSKNLSFCKEGLMLDGKEDPLQMDIVVFSTGFRGDQKLTNIFTSPTFRKYIMGSPTSTRPLYRECVHPRIPQLAILGYSESMSNLYTSEMRARWIAHLFAGTFKLPSINEMEKEVLNWEKYMKRYTSDYRRSSICTIHVWYNDQLCRDMGWNPKRKKGFLAELFEPYGPRDYVNMAPN